jgi:hypothetical protein
MISYKSSSTPQEGPSESLTAKRMPGCRSLPRRATRPPPSPSPPFPPRRLQPRPLPLPPSVACTCGCRTTGTLRRSDCTGTSCLPFCPTPAATGSTREPWAPLWSISIPPPFAPFSDPRVSGAYTFSTLLCVKYCRSCNHLNPET